MYKAKSLAMTHRLRRFTQPVILVSSTVIGASIANARAKPLHCQRGETLDLADPPYRSSPYQHSFPDERAEYRRSTRGRSTSMAAGQREEEELVPAVLYITAAGFVGAFLARKSNFLVRFVSPFAFALGAAAYTIPRTTNKLLDGLKTYDYRQIGQEAQHKVYHLQQSAVSAKDTVVGLAGGTVDFALGGFQAAEHKAKEVAHDLEDQSHKLQKKAQHAFEGVQRQSSHVAHELKDRSEEAAHDIKAKGREVAQDWKAKGQEVAHDLKAKGKEATQDWKAKGQEFAQDWKAKGQEVAQDWKAKGHEAANRAQATAESFKDDAEASAQKARQWVHSHVDEAQRTIPKEFDSFKRSAHEAGEHAKEEWSQRQRQVRQDVHDGAERGWDRVRNWAREEGEKLRERRRGEVEEEWPRGRSSRRSWVVDEEPSELQHEWQQQQQQQEHQQPSWREWHRTREARWQQQQQRYGDQENMEARPTTRDEEYRGRERHPRTYPSSPFQRDDGEGEYEEESRGARPRYRHPSVFETVREEGQQSWARAKQQQQSADRFSSSSQDRAPSPARQWWNTHTKQGGEPMSSRSLPSSASPPSPASPSYEHSHQWEDRLGQVKDRVKRQGFQTDVDHKMQEGRRWWQEQIQDAKRKGREEMDHVEDYGRKLGDRLRDRFEYQGRDVDGLDGSGMGPGDMPGQRYGRGGHEFQHHHHPHEFGYHPLGFGGQHPNPHGSVYSDDNWFHYEPSHGQRRGERGM
ncbi:hypothetical protein DFQ26_009174 [Actinomortierella ambigua]|nr:hypothetical protein DFQ26_009174 [Actinomortierella ambigua]